MEVWIVEYEKLYDGYQFFGVYSTEEKAKARADEVKKKKYLDPDYVQIIDWLVDTDND